MKPFFASVFLSLYFVGFITLIGPKREDMEEVECRDGAMLMMNEPCYQAKEPLKFVFYSILSAIPILAIGGFWLHKNDALQRAEALKSWEEHDGKSYEERHGPRSDGNLVNLHERRMRRYNEGLPKKYRR